MSSRRRRSERNDDLSMEAYRDRARLKDLEDRAALSRKNNEQAPPIRREDDSSNQS